MFSGFRKIYSAIIGNYVSVEWILCLRRAISYSKITRLPMLELVPFLAVVLHSGRWLSLHSRSRCHRLFYRCSHHSPLQGASYRNQGLWNEATCHHVVRQPSCISLSMGAPSLFVHAIPHQEPQDNHSKECFPPSLHIYSRNSSLIPGHSSLLQCSLLRWLHIGELHLWDWDFFSSIIAFFMFWLFLSTPILKWKGTSP